MASTPTGLYSESPSTVDKFSSSNGASRHYLKDLGKSSKCDGSHRSITVAVANNAVIRSTGTEILPLNLPSPAKNAHTFTDINKSLVSMDQFTKTGL